MATEGPLDRWFVGEHKILRWTTRDRSRNVVNVTDWTVTATVYRRREAAPLATLTAAVVDAPGGIIAVDVPAALTTTWGPGSYRVVAKRIDLGAEQVIADEDFTLLTQGQ